MTSSILPRSPQRSAASLLETLVAFTLLSTVLSVATPLVVRHGRLLSSSSDYRIALDELTNQFERLTVLSPAELTEAIEQLAPSSFAADRLPGAELTAELQRADFGNRLTLRLTWNEPQRRAAPVALTAWVFPDDDLPSQNPPEDRAP